MVSYTYMIHRFFRGVSVRYHARYVVVEHVDATTSRTHWSRTAVGIDLWTDGEVWQNELQRSEISFGVCIITVEEHVSADFRGIVPFMKVNSTLTPLFPEFHVC